MTEPTSPGGEPQAKVPVLSLEFHAVADLRSEVDPIEFFATMSDKQRPYYVRWKPEDDEHWADEDVPAWLKPYAYLVGWFIENCDASAPWAPGFTDRTDFEHREDIVRKRGAEYVHGREARRWSEADYNTLLNAVPWLMTLDDPEHAAEFERTRPIPGDQPLFGGDR